MFALSVLDATGGTVLTRPLGERPLYVGRAPHNDLVLDDPAVSSRHLAAWIGQGRCFVEDLGSRNGTWLDGARLRGTRAVSGGTELRLGERIVVRIEDDDETADAGPGLLVHAVDGSVSVPVQHDRFVIGPAPGAHLRVSIPPPETAVLFVQAEGELSLGRGDDQVSIQVGEPFEIAGRVFVVRGSPRRVLATLEQGQNLYPYRLRAELQGPTGPRAVIDEPRSSLTHTIEAGTRAVLLYLLAQRRRQDATGGVPESHAGWCPDGELGAGIWGRAWENKNLNVLCTRVRAEVREAGFDPWFLEKRQGHTRVRLDDVQVA